MTTDIDVYRIERQSAIKSLQYECWETAEDHGWHDKDKVPNRKELALLIRNPLKLHELAVRLLNEPPTTFGDRLALIVSEVSEALEEFRNGHVPTEVYYNGEKPEGVPIELADVLVRVFDLAEIYGIDMSEALATKMEYNKTREYRHGGKAL